MSEALAAIVASYPRPLARQPPTKGRSTIYTASGGAAEGRADFAVLTGATPSPTDETRVAALPGGLVANVRGTSTDGRPTIEVRHGKRSVKVRYGG